MSPRVQLVAVIASLLVIAYVFDLVRRKRLAEEYSVFWIAASMLLLLVSAWKELLFWIAEALGIANAVSLIVFLLALFFVMYALHLSVRVSTLAEQNRELIQWVGLLRQQIAEAQKDSSSGGPPREESPDVEARCGTRS